MAEDGDPLSTAEPTGHPWWQHVPRSEKPRLLRRLRRRELFGWLKQRRQLVVVSAAVFCLISSLPIWMGATVLSVMSLLQLLLVPALAGLAWWLTWREFNH